jgi:hypothetical protein
MMTQLTKVMLTTHKRVSFLRSSTAHAIPPLVADMESQRSEPEIRFVTSHNRCAFP